MRSKRTEKQRQDQQKAADDAVIMSQVGYLDAINLDNAAEAVSRGHLRLQHENHFSIRLFALGSRKTS